MPFAVYNTFAVYAVRCGAAPFEARAVAVPFAARAVAVPFAARAVAVPFAARAVAVPFVARAAGLPSLPFVCRIACPRHAAVLPAVRFFLKKFFEKFVCKRLTSAMEVV